MVEAISASIMLQGSGMLFGWSSYIVFRIASFFEAQDMVVLFISKKGRHQSIWGLGNVCVGSIFDVFFFQTSFKWMTTANVLSFLVKSILQTNNKHIRYYNVLFTRKHKTSATQRQIQK